MGITKNQKYTIKECLKLPFIVKEFNGSKFYAIKPIWKEEKKKVNQLCLAGLAYEIEENWYVLTEAGIHSRYLLLFQYSKK